MWADSSELRRAHASSFTGGVRNGRRPGRGRRHSSPIEGDGAVTTSPSTAGAGDSVARAVWVRQRHSKRPLPPKLATNRTAMMNPFRGDERLMSAPPLLGRDRRLDGGGHHGMGAIDLEVDAALDQPLG